MRTVTTKLSDFFPTHHKIREEDILPPYSPSRCPYCGGLDIVRKGKSKRTRKGDQQRYYCKHCHRRFIDSPISGSHFPEWVIDEVLALTAGGLRPRGITEAIVRESTRTGHKVSMSTHTVRNLVKTCIKSPLEFELLTKREEATREWVIDDAYQRFPLENRKRIVGWITNIFELGTVYWLVAHVSLRRDKDVTSEAFGLAVKRAKGAPLHVKSDGLRSNILGIKELYPQVIIDSKTKKQDYGWINELEGLHNIMRGAGISRRGFRSLRNLQARLDLLRFHYNFLRPHSSLKGEGETPARVAGILYPQTSNWSEFIRFTHWYVDSQKEQVSGGRIDAN